MTSSLTTFDAFLKERYTKDKIENLTLADRPLWAMVPRDPGVSGDVFVEPIIIGNPQGLGATRAKAQAGAVQTGDGANVIGKKWNLTFGDYAGSVYIGEKVIRASRDDQGAFLRNQSTEIDLLYEGFADTFASYLYSNGGMAIGTGTISTGVITLTDPEAMSNFFLGQVLVASANDGSDVAHTLLGAGTQGYVIALSHENGTVTVSTTSGGSAGTPGSWSGTMFFFRDGDFGGSGATPIFKGLGGWIPGTAPGGTDSWYSVNRSTNDLLSGCRLTASDISGAGIEQRVKKLATRMISRWKGPGPTHIYMNPEKWQSLADSLESRGTRPIDGKVGTFNFSKLQLAMAGRNVEVYGDRFCPLNKCYALKLDTWKLRSYGPVPDVVKGDGLQMLRLATADTYEHRILAFPVFSTRAPSYNGVVTV
jgi:hypothetical protein